MELIKKQKNMEKLIVISDGNLYHHQWIEELVSEDYLLMISSDIPIPDTLRSVKSSEFGMLLIYPNAKSGLTLINYVNEVSTELRRAIPGAAIGIVCHNDNNVTNEAVLPPLVFHINPHTTREEFNSMIANGRKSMKARNQAFRPFGSYSVEPKRDNKVLKCKSTLPNFNLKHSGMLVPIAHAAKEMNMPVFVEVSAQEALVYYNTPEIDCKLKVGQAFKQIRKDVDYVCEHLGVDIYLHLDHCSDPDLIFVALDCGFDSIMADRSTGTLQENIRFVNKAKVLSDAYGVPIEGEIGAIDLDGLRKKSTTILKDAYRFIEETDLDFVGINVGQYHSGDYGYDKALKASALYMEISQRNSHKDLNLLNSCLSIDEEIEKRALNSDFNIRGDIKKIVDLIVRGKVHDYDDLLNSIESNLSVKDAFWLKELRIRWQKGNDKTTRHLSDLYSQIMSRPVSHDPTKNKSLDFDLLLEMSEWLKGRKTRMVIHGGSSIEANDLPFFNGFDIARVNLGSTPYLLYIEALRSMGIGKYNNYSEKFSGLNENNIAFMQEFGKEWKDWTVELPIYLENLKSELEHRYFRPFFETQTLKS